MPGRELSLLSILMEHWTWKYILVYHGRIQDFKLGGKPLKKLGRAKGGANFDGVFRVKNHDFTQKNHIYPWV
jgi:hypothetical protein